MAIECKRFSLIFVILAIFFAFCMYKIHEKREESVDWKKVRYWLKDNDIVQYQDLMEKLEVDSFYDVALIDIKTLGKNVNDKFRSAVRKMRDEVELEYLFDKFKISKKNFKKIKSVNSIVSVTQLCNQLLTMKIDRDISTKITELCHSVKQQKSGSHVKTEDLKKWINQQKGFTLKQINIRIGGYI